MSGLQLTESKEIQVTLTSAGLQSPGRRRLSRGGGGGGGGGSAAVCTAGRSRNTGHLASGGKQWISRPSGCLLYAAPEPGGHAHQRLVTLIGLRSRGPRACPAPLAPPIPGSARVQPCEPCAGRERGAWCLEGHTRRARKTHSLRMGLRRGRAQFPFCDQKYISSMERLLCAPRGAKHFPPGVCKFTKSHLSAAQLENGNKEATSRDCSK